MKNLVRIYVTCRIIVSSLFPGEQKEVPDLHSTEHKPLTISPQQSRACIGALSHCNHSLNLLFSHAFSIAAPFLLFRLKRLGYSNCHVVVLSDGLLVSADR